ncbi:MAG: hypothetical protein EAX95_11790 [Candidatus Thorarchaeota archaeon]|nr:hypothetical protein [Candidatus Thorarchaeota archaeon]
MRGGLRLPLILALFLLLIAMKDVSAIGFPQQQGIHMLAQGGETPPTVDWFGIPMNWTDAGTICWDGVYNGQTEQVWTFEHWVNDSDGVDTVIFQFKKWGEEIWLDRPGILIDGNMSRGFYKGNFTYNVWWDWETNWVRSEVGSFCYRLFANDTLGNWVTTPPLCYTGGYMLVYPPPQYYLIANAPLLLTGASVIAIIIVVVVVLRRSPGRGT